MKDKEVFEHFGYSFPPEECTAGTFPKKKLFSELELLPDQIKDSCRLEKGFRITVDYDPEYPDFMIAIWPKQRKSGETVAEITPEEREKTLELIAKYEEMDHEAMRKVADMMVEELCQTMRTKRALAVRIFLDILDSEAFTEHYPRVRTPEKIKIMLTRALWKNGVSTEDGKRMFAELAEEYAYKDRSVVRPL